MEPLSDPDLLWVSDVGEEWVGVTVSSDDEELARRPNSSSKSTFASREYEMSANSFSRNAWAIV